MFLMLLVSLVTSAMAQKPGWQPSYQDFFKHKCDFIVREMNLSSADSCKFVPLYCCMMKEKFEMMKKYESARQLGMRVRRDETLTDAEYTQLAEARVNLKVEEATIERTWLEKFKSVLSPKQLCDYTKAEKKFSRDVMKGGRDFRKMDKK